MIIEGHGSQELEDVLLGAHANKGIEGVAGC
jgi:hypothetical protein